MKQKTFLGVSLADGVSRGNLLSYLYIALISSGYAGLLAMLEPGLLQEMDVPYEEQGTLTGNLRVAQEFVYIIMLAVYGSLADKLGRRPIYVWGLVVNSLGWCLYPFATTVPELYLYRLLIALGGAAVIGMMVTVVADYTRDETRGRANGLQGAVATLGAFIPPILGFMPQLFVGQGLSQIEALQATFALAAVLGFSAAAVAWGGLAKAVGKQINEARESLMSTLKGGLSEAKDPGIALSYGAAFISRGDLAVTGAFMGLWLVQWGKIELGMETSQAMFELAAPRVMVTVCGAFVGALLMGYISDKISRVMAVTIASGLASIVYLAMYFVGDPTESWVMVLLLIMGIAEISAFVSSQALVGQQASSRRRGAVIGFFGVAGAFGILLGSGGGGWLFRHVGPSAPFVLFGALNLMVFIWSLLVRSKVIEKQPGDIDSVQALV
ncbi:MAG: MFS transporter [Pseudomonadales bacterium]